MPPSEIETRDGAVRVGGVIQVGLAALTATYALLTWHGHARPFILAAGVAAGLVGGLILWRAPGWLTAPSQGRGAMVAWNISHSALIVVLCAVDGGLDSPFVGIFFISAVFTALDQPAGMVGRLAAMDVAAIGLLALLEHQLTPHALYLAGTLSTITFVSGYVARDREARLDAVRASKQELVHRLARVVEHRDSDTGEHIERMSCLSAMIAGNLGWSEAACADLRLASTMHDVGKVAVPDAILLKPGPLTPDERAVMETHARVGHDMLADSESPVIQLAARIALTHHERYDGTGYPQRLAGDAIPLEGRIVAVADVFDALTSDRCYRPALALDQALAILEEGRGTHFDPAVLDAFLAGLPGVLARRGHDAAPAPPAPAAVAA